MPLVTCQVHLIYIDGTLNSNCYILVVLKPVDQFFLQGHRNGVVQQDNARQHVTSIVLIFLHAENVRLLHWPGHSRDVLSIENNRSMDI